MSIEQLLPNAIWVQEAIGGKEVWARYTDNFFNSGDVACFAFLQHEMQMHVYACCRETCWTIWCHGQGDADAPLVTWLSCECYGRSLREAAAVAAGLLLAISKEEVDYVLSTERSGVKVA